VPVHTHGSLLAGRYRVESRLGAGGMASVWLCHDERLDRPVAVKRLHADSPRDAERRFLREAKLGASMNHPNLVSVFDTETDDEGLLIVMEYVEGESLAQALRRGSLGAARVGEIARELGAALDHVHANGVVHRDVKPANVLLRHDGAVKLVDLGIAVSVDQTRVTRSGTVLGSAAYMAPEQLEGADVGPAADVYALAAVCFEALAGRKAREGRTPVEIAHSVATTPPPDVRDHAPSVPAAAAAALARGTASEPAERQRSAGELAFELANALERGRRERSEARTLPLAASAPVPRTAPPVAPPASRTSASRRARSFAGPLAAVLILLAAAAVVAAVLLAGGNDGDKPQADRPTQQEQREQAQSPAQSDEASPDEGETGQTTETNPAEPDPAESAPADAPIDPAQGTALNEQGYALMQQGDYAGAVPVLRRAVASWPEDSTDLDYAYALYNLGASLNRSGSPAEAIPYLEKRLNWSNQRGVVKRELEDAQRNAGQG
jgi:eukaryotic-like serine/threonine-protein kinase